MRIFLLLSSLLALFHSEAQTNQRVQLKTIVAEAPNDFNAFKGELQTSADDDSFYSSVVTIDGSKQNEITQFAGKLTQYHAYIADSADKKKSKALVEQWRTKIKATYPDFYEEVVNSMVQKRSTNGYRFSKIIGKDLCTISIVRSKREIDGYFWVLLTVTHQGKAVLGDSSGNE